VTLPVTVTDPNQPNVTFLIFLHISGRLKLQSSTFVHRAAISSFSIEMALPANRCDPVHVIHF